MNLLYIALEAEGEKVMNILKHLAAKGSDISILSLLAKKIINV